MTNRTEPNHRGRPRAKNARTSMIGVRLTADESLAIRLAATRDGLSLSGWLRAKAREALFAESIVGG